MVDWVPVASVLATATVGITGTVTQFLLARSAQRDQRLFVQEARAAEARRDAAAMHGKVAEWCVLVQALVDSPSVKSFAEAQRDGATDAAVLVHAPPLLRTALREFDDALTRAEPAVRDALWDLEAARVKKETALDEGDFARASAWRVTEVATLHELRPMLDALREPLQQVEDALAHPGHPR
jgi:hypothetical protein